MNVLKHKNKIHQSFSFFFLNLCSKHFPKTFSLNVFIQLFKVFIQNLVSLLDLVTIQNSKIFDCMKLDYKT